MTRTTTASADSTHAPVSSYQAGWPDRLADRVEALPGPAWCYYAAVWAVLFGSGILLARNDFGDKPGFGGAVRYYAIFTGLLGYVFGLKHYLRSYARVALEGFRPVYREEDSVSGQMVTPAEAQFQLTNAPALPTLFWTAATMSLVGALMLLGLAPFQRLGIALSPASVVFSVVLELGLWAIFGPAIYSIIRTLRLVSRFYTRHARVSLFQLQPLYAFSALTVRYALGILVGPAIFFSREPGLLTNSITAALAVGAAVAAFSLFAAPLAGAHQLLAAEKNALLAQNALRLREALDRLHAAADGEEAATASNIQLLLFGLQHERTIVEAMRTWPWQPGLFRAFLTALLLPMVVWLIQFLLVRQIGT